jgi:hypothetical protein
MGEKALGNHSHWPTAARLLENALSCVRAWEIVSPQSPLSLPLLMLLTLLMLLMLLMLLS